MPLKDVEKVPAAVQISVYDMVEGNAARLKAVAKVHKEARISAKPMGVANAASGELKALALVTLCGTVMVTELLELRVISLQEGKLVFVLPTVL